MKISRLLFCSVALTALLGASNVSAQPFVMRISSPVVGETQNEWMRLFKAGVEARSQGQLKVELFEGNVLGQMPATVEGVALGTIEMTIPSVGFLVGLEPRFQVLDAPGLFDSLKHGQNVLDDPEVRRRLSTFGDLKGVETLIAYVASPTVLLTRAPLREISQLKGLKIRTAGGAPLYIEPMRRLGASPVAMPLGDVMSAMQNHAIDGTTAGYVPFVTFKYYDIARDLTELPGSFLLSVGIVNRAFLKKIGAPLEKIIREESRKAESVFYEWGPANLAKMQSTWKSKGGRINAFSDPDKVKYVQEVSAAARPILSADPQIKEDYQALKDAAQRYR